MQWQRRNKTQAENLRNVLQIHSFVDGRKERAKKQEREVSMNEKSRKSKQGSCCCGCISRRLKKKKKQMMKQKKSCKKSSKHDYYA